MCVVCITRKRARPQGEIVVAIGVYILEKKTCYSIDDRIDIDMNCKFSLGNGLENKCFMKNHLIKNSSWWNPMLLLGKKEKKKKKEIVWLP